MALAKILDSNGNVAGIDINGDGSSDIVFLTDTQTNLSFSSQEKDAIFLAYQNVSANGSTNAQTLFNDILAGGQALKIVRRQIIRDIRGVFRLEALAHP